MLGEVEAGVLEPVVVRADSPVQVTGIDVGVQSVERFVGQR